VLCNYCQLQAPAAPVGLRCRCLQSADGHPLREKEFGLEISGLARLRTRLSYLIDRPAVRSGGAGCVCVRAAGVGCGLCRQCMSVAYRRRAAGDLSVCVGVGCIVIFVDLFVICRVNKLIC